MIYFRKWYLLVIVTASLIYLIYVTRQSLTSFQYAVTSGISAYIKKIVEDGRKEEPRDVTLLLLLAYQRTGSSFIGRRAFNERESVFYLYEPLAPLYGAMYGLVGGDTAVPDDIFSNSDGSPRSVPEVERNAIHWTMDKIYNCELSSLPLAMLSHDFWHLFTEEMTHARRYVSCLTSNGIHITQSYRRCHANISKICGRRFLAKPDAAERCRRILWGDDLRSADATYVPNCNRNRKSITDRSLPKQFIRYYNCLMAMQPALTRCAAKNLDEPCNRSRLRVMKTVRASMDDAEYLLSHHRNAYLIHLYRDPLAAVRSRLENSWSQALTTKNDVGKIAELYCFQTLRDISRRLTLQRRGFAARVMQLTYEEFIRDPDAQLSRIYQFVGRRRLPEVSGPHSNDNRSITQTVSRRRTLDIEKRNLVLEKCSLFFNETSLSHWP